MLLKVINDWHQNWKYRLPVTHLIPVLWQKVLNPVEPVLTVDAMNPAPLGQFRMLIQAVREAPSGPHVSGREKQL